MLRQKSIPSVYWYDGVTTTGISYFMLNYGRDTQVLPLETTHYLYFGRSKPFNAFYVEMGSTVNAVATTLTLEYYDGSVWSSVTNLIDDTQGFKRSGFIQFDRPLDWELFDVASDEKYYLRITVSANITAGTSFQGMNIVYSDDQDLNGVYPGILNYLNGESSFILRHENSRDLIVQEIRNRGFTKRNSNRSYYEQIDPWDILDVEEVRMWSIYLTLANIFSSLQSNTTDLFKEKSEEYLQKAEFYKAQFFLTLDKDDDGVVDSSESASNISSRRIIRN